MAFLKSRPSVASRARTLPRPTSVETSSSSRASEVYLRYHAGQARSKMSPAFFEKALGTPATVRTWKVVTKLAS